MKIAYCDCFSGISGDMFLAALIDAGLPIEVLGDELKKLNLIEFHHIFQKTVMKNSISATSIVFDIDETGTHHRHYSDICRLINASALSNSVKERSLCIFEKLAMAEAKIHNVKIDDVHFHEVGAVDSILDIVGAAIGLDYFQIGSLYSSSIPMSHGIVKTQHGDLPLPAPATLELIRIANGIVKSSPASIELVTPTGAAILAAFATFSMPEMRLERIGVGAGKKDLEWPNIMRLWIGETTENLSSLIQMDTNIDDMNPQLFGNVMGKLFEVGALDVFFTPIQMKKNRPATMISVIAKREQEQKLAELILRETSSFGVRIHPVYRFESPRTFKTVPTQYGDIQVKVKYEIDTGKIIQWTPEYEQCTAAAHAAGVSTQAVIFEVLLAAKELF